jgi:hypothetical protein
VTNIFSNCDSTIMGNSSNKEKDKELNGINIPKVRITTLSQLTSQRMCSA